MNVGLVKGRLSHLHRCFVASSRTEQPVSHSRNQLRFAAHVVAPAPRRDHLDEPALIARVQAEQVVLGIETAVAGEGERAAALVARVAPDTFIAGLLVGGIDDAPELRGGQLDPRCGPGCGEPPGFMLQGGHDTRSHGFQFGRQDVIHVR